MRTTLTIDDDVLVTAQFLAREKNASVGRIISDLARQALRGSTLDNSPTNLGCAEPSPLERQLSTLGLVPFKPESDEVVTDAAVDALRQSEGI